MTDRTKIIMIYLGVALICVGILGVSLWVKNARDQAERGRVLVEGAGKDEPAVLRVLEGDLTATNQEGDEVRISQLDEKVWVVNQFFANCPVCLKQNSEDMIRLYREFSDHPDFHMVSITVDPERDTVEQLGAYAEAVGAKTDSWWFLRGEKEKIYDFLSEEMKYTRVKENPELTGAKRFAHDFGVQVYGRERRLVKTRDLVSAKAQGEDLHRKSYEELRARIAERLETPLGELQDAE